MAIVRGWRNVLASVGLVVGLLTFATARGEATEAKRVLILYSNESFLPANVALGSSLVGHLREGIPGGAEFFSEFLDLVRFSGEAHAHRTVDALRAKYEARRFDLIIAAGPQALDLVAAHREALFPGVPLVFTGVGMEDAARHDFTTMTGILMRLDPVPTLELALRLRPGTRRVVVVTGASGFDRSWENVARRRYRGYADRLEIDYWSGLPMDRLRAELKSLGPDAVVVFLSHFNDGAGRYFLPADAARLVAEASAAPVFGLYDTYLGTGVVGGCTDPFDHVGRETARIGLRVLAGERPETIAPRFPGDPVTIVDWRQLRRWGWSESMLPQGSEVRFRQASLWEEHRDLVLAAAAVVTLQSLLLVGLLLQRRNRRRAEREVRRQEERFRTVVESTPNAIIMVDAANVIVLVNSQAEQSFGYARAELIGQEIVVLVAAPFRAALLDDLRECAFLPPSLPAPPRRELHGRRKDRSAFPVEVGLTPIQTGEGPFVLATIVDVTERKQAEETRQELAHAARLAIAGELTASIAHEINQPLGAILSNADAAEMLLDSSPESLDEVRTILDDIRKDDLRASEVIRRLRTLLRKREMEMQPVDLNEVIADVLGLIRAESGRRGLAIETELAAGLPLVRGDKVHLQQVLLNLLLNGMEAMAGMPGARRISVRIALVENGTVEVAVSDTGAGIALDRLPRLFDPFYSTKKEGMGLGLPIARSLVEAHGGRIWAANNPGGGAIFRFTLPVGDANGQNGAVDALRMPREFAT